MLCTVVKIRATFLTSQRCMAVSIDTPIAVAKFHGQFWSHAWLSVHLGCVETYHLI